MGHPLINGEAVCDLMGSNEDGLESIGASR